LVYLIGVPEILRRAQHVSARTHRPLVAYSIAAAIYFLMVYTANRLLDTIERKTEIPSI
jgi:polar amino acid transport system permease protein